MRSADRLRSATMLPGPLALGIMAMPSIRGLGGEFLAANVGFPNPNSMLNRGKKVQKVAATSWPTEFTCSDLDGLDPCTSTQSIRDLK
ncbi:hypothetical protein Mapa_002912 [Marchantia paleacea]|nr:hypothetical protein Mapa_002912 [Marchantia paleacea]